MTPTKKPSFLKTFSEFTIEELRAMPLHQLFSLFFQEIGSTFTEREVVKKRKRIVKSKKNSSKEKIKPAAEKSAQQETIVFSNS